MKDSPVALGAEPSDAQAAGAALHLAAVVVTHNRLGQLRRTLRALLSQPLDRIFVADNASTDGTADWLALQNDPRLTVLRLPDNRGGAGGFEAGLAAVTDEGRAHWTVLMDDDARPAPGAIAAFRQLARGLDPDAATRGATGVVGAAVFRPDGRICEMNRPTLNPFWSLPLLLRTLLRGGDRKAFHLEDAVFLPDAPTRMIDVASFVGFFVSRGAVARTGLPDGGLFIYADDVLYSLKLRKAGFRILFAPQVRFEHDCRSLDASMALRPLWKVYYLCRNNIAVARSAAGPLLFPLALGWFLYARFSRARQYPPEERAEYRALVWWGIRDGFLRRRGRNDDVHRAAVADRLAPDDGRTARPD